MKTVHAVTLVSFLSIILVISRWFPHSANWTPVLAICLFVGFLSKKQGFLLLLPLLGIFISDFLIGFYPGWVFNYISYALLLGLGATLRFKPTAFIGGGLLGALLFFFLSNLGVWLTSTLYPPTLEGLLICYEMGLPFFRATLTSTVLGMGGAYLFFWAYAHMLPESGKGFLKKHG